MKVRSDFVTNSSSSSFVIGKKDDASATIESVYQIVRGFYIDFLYARDEAQMYIASNPEFPVKYISDEDGYCYFECIEKNRDKYWQVKDLFEEKFGISTFEYFAPQYEWLDCDSYLEYEKYWLGKMKDSHGRDNAPFTIADFLEEKEVEWLHYHFNPEYGTKVHAVNSKSDVLGWYFPYIEEAFEYANDCDKCRYKGCCYEDKCANSRSTIVINNVPEDKACLYMLGRVCIHSECGYMPNYVVDRLCDISEYSCNHMG